MYNQFFGLRKNAFNMTPDPAFLFMTPQHREALVGLTYSILQQKGFVVLTGEAGTGKTTLIARVLQYIPSSRLQFSVILNPTLTPSEFLEMALLDFGVTDVPASKAQRLWKLQNLLFEGQQKGKISVLIIDEAHKLTPEVLEEIRLLGNFEEADHKLLQILLVGQSELDNNLDRADLRQFKQRIAFRLSIGPLASSEVGDYIKHRWTTAGGAEPPFSAAAVRVIADASRGIPRLINSLCENALTYAFAEGVTAADAPHVEMAVMDLKLRPAAAAQEVSQPQPREQAPQPTPAVEPVSAPEESPEMTTFEHYADASPVSSFWSRWAAKLRFTNAG